MKCRRRSGLARLILSACLLAASPSLAATVSPAAVPGAALPRPDILTPTWSSAPLITPLQLTRRPASRPRAARRAEDLPSGLPWASGTGCWDTSFDTMRSRPSDVYNTFVGRSTRNGVLNSIRDVGIGRFAAMPGTLVLSFPMVTNDIAGQFAQCIAGNFDGYVRDAATALKNHGFVDPIIRLGWEPNGNFPWALGRFPERDRQYIGCFQRQATIFRNVLPEVQIDWVNRRDGSIPYTSARSYPEDDYVDIIGLMIYDRWPTHPNQAAWNSAYTATKFNGPKGLGTYLDFARLHSKPFSVSEWAVSNNNNDPKSTDNPFFITKMHEFFESHASEIAYEAYFNCGSYTTTGTSGGFRLSPNTINPLSRAEYVRLWKPGESTVTPYEAEAAAISQGVIETEHAGYTGTGFVNYRNRVNSSILWSVDAVSTGSAVARFRFANGTTSSRPLEISVNNVVINPSLSFPSTGTWPNWTTRELTVQLQAGDQYDPGPCNNFRRWPEHGPARHRAVAEKGRAAEVALVFGMISVETGTLAHYRR